MICLALATFSVKHEHSHPGLSERACDLAIYPAKRHGLRPIDALAII
jgi:hypothetical protein